MPYVPVCVELPASLGPAAAFGVSELEAALHARGYRASSEVADLRVLVQGDQGLEDAEAYRISHTGPTDLTIAGSDDHGILYGCLDLAEQLWMGRDLTSAAERTAKPELAVRGLYTFLHNSEAEKGWLYDPAYWQAYADELARCRFNRFNLIYGHQSPHMIPIYAFLLDELDADFPRIRVQGITTEERARNLDALQTASAAMAGRGLAFFLGIWNSRPWKVENGVWETQPTRVSGTDDLGLLVSYTRQGFTRLIERCPAIRGIQLRMNIESGVADQRFFVQALVPALQDLARRGRRLTIELRNWGLLPDTLEAFRSVGMDIVVSTKYFAEHQGMPYQPPVQRGSYSYDSFLRKDKPFPFQWHVWNLGSHRLFAWGDPGYARRLVESCHLGDGVGFEVTPPGSQKGFSQWGQVSPGDWQPRADLPARWDFQRYWFFHATFGRLAYDTSTPDEVFVHQLARRTTAEAGPVLLEAYRAASQVISYLISKRMDDPNMYVWPELDAGGPIDHDTIAPPGEVTLFATAREYAQNVVAGRASAKVSPLDAARDLDGMADRIQEHLARLAALPGLDDKLEVRQVRVDFGALAALARYHAAKARAAGNLALFYVSGERRFLDVAEKEAEDGIRLWDELCHVTEGYYHKLHFGPSGGHWRDNKPRVAYDLQRIRRVRELFERYGLFSRGFDFGPSAGSRLPARSASGLEPEPRFLEVDSSTPYSPQRGYGWLQAAGLRTHGFGSLSHELLWGVHHIRPGAEYDPAAIEAMPRDGLTQRYVTGQSPHTFRVDLANGEYEVTLLGPAVTASATVARVGGRLVQLAGSGTLVARTRAPVTMGALEVTVGGDGPWALAGLIVRPVGPLIAHLPPAALHAGKPAILTATATGTDEIVALTLRYKTPTGVCELGMSGDGTAFQATVPAGDLGRAALSYQIVAQDACGRSTQSAVFQVPIVKGFRAPRIQSAMGPATWSPTRRLEFRALLEHGEYARQVILHYREADQNRDFRATRLEAGRSGEFVFFVDPRHLDGLYELIYYFEVQDVLGGGMFYPDPFTECRYWIARPE